jgi:predicted membrane-bound dolichyl-phosphate-mannose-protein mannosyltransferase
MWLPLVLTDRAYCLLIYNASCWLTVPSVSWHVTLSGNSQSLLSPDTWRFLVTHRAYCLLIHDAFCWLTVPSVSWHVTLSGNSQSLLSPDTWRFLVTQRSYCLLIRDAVYMPTKPHAVTTLTRCLRAYQATRSAVQQNANLLPAVLHLRK